MIGRRNEEQTRMGFVVTAFMLTASLWAMPVRAQVSDCDIALSVGATPEVGAIQVLLTYDPAAGFILGEGADAQCSTLIVHDIDTHNHNVATATVRSAIVTLVPLVGPAPLLTCRFRAIGTVPDASAFTAVAVETVAPAPSFASLPNPLLTVGVGACEGVTTTTTTSTTTTTTTTSSTSTTTTTMPSTTTTTMAASGSCGLPVSAGPLPTATDALAVLRAAVGLLVCAPCVCDADSSGAITATDALIVLRAAVGIADARMCPPCV